MNMPDPDHSKGEHRFIVMGMGRGQPGQACIDERWLFNNVLFTYASLTR